MTRVLTVVALFLFAAAPSGTLAGRPGAPPWGGEKPLEVGIDEKLGAFVPLDLGFLDSYGDSVYLRNLIARPTVLVLVYFHCPTICKPLLSGVADVVEKTDLTPGRDYDLITVSFDEYDNPSSASNIRSNFVTGLRKEIPPNAWRFLTGDSAAIDGLTGAVGFRFKRRENDFAHPTALIVLSPDGKIARYLYGLNFMPFDLKMAVAEAAEGRTAPSITRVLQFCFSYDPAGRRYVFEVTRVAGTGIVVLVFGYVLYISVAGKLRKQRGRR